MLNKMSYDQSGLHSVTDGEGELVEDGSNVPDSTVLIDLYRVTKSLKRPWNFSIPMEARARLLNLRVQLVLLELSCTRRF